MDRPPPPKPPPLYPRIAHIFETKRQAAGISVNQLHQVTTIPYVTLTRLLAGGADFKSSHLQSLATALGTSVSEVTAEAEGAAA